jgi:predicted DNA-binding transcriptional regulator AlpA
MSEAIETLPPLADILSENPGWLDEAISTRVASRLTGVSVCTLETWRSRGGGPKFIKIGAKMVRYQRRSLLEWMASQERRNTSDLGPLHG